MTRIDEPPQPDLVGTLWQITSSIPARSVSSYGRVAQALGDPKAARWVASELLKHTPHGACCPCFRVVRQGGIIGSFAHGDSIDKAALISADGAKIAQSNQAAWQITDPNWAQLPELESPPFEVMRRWQVDVSRTKLPTTMSIPDRIAGLDVSYTSDGRAVAACVITETQPIKRKPARVLWTGIAVTKAVIPYVTGYLAFRELPALLAVYEQAVAEGEWPGLAMIDGSGRLHPRRSGLASCFSIATGEPSIGITKTRLMGQFDSEQLTSKACQPIQIDNKHVGTAHQSPTGGKPIFASPGCGITQAEVDRLVAASMTIHRVPEPIYWADRLSRKHAKNVGVAER